MKKRLAGIISLSMVLALTLGMTAFAAGSTSTGTTPKSSEAKTQAEEKATEYANAAVTGSVIVDGVAQDVAVTVAPVGVSVKNAAEAYAAAAIAPTAKVLQIVDVSLPVSFSKVQLTFSVPGVVSGQKIAVLHQKADGTWETILPDAVGDGTVTATFTSLSPVAFVSYNASPKTADAFPFAIAAAVICLAGTAVCSKKVSFNK